MAVDEQRGQKTVGMTHHIVLGILRNDARRLAVRRTIPWLLWLAVALVEAAVIVRGM